VVNTTNSTEKGVAWTPFSCHQSFTNLTIRHRNYRLSHHSSQTCAEYPRCMGDCATICNFAASKATNESDK
jgi:hypothetical protein